MKLVKLIKRRCMSFVVGHHKVGQSYIIVQLSWHELPC